MAIDILLLFMLLACVVAVLWPFLFYPLILRALATKAEHPVAGPQPTASLLFCAYNEASAMPEKLANLRAPHGTARPVETSELTRREKEVLSLMCEGADDAAIAKELGVSRNTLRNHVARVYAKIGVNRRAQAILWARERGYPLQRPIR